MTRAKQTPQIRTRLEAGDVQKFDQICRLHGKTNAAMARVAILEFLDKQEKGLNSTYESLLEKRMKKMEDRLAALMAKTAIDSRTTLNLIFRNMDPKARDKAYAWARNGAVQSTKSKPAEDLAALLEEERGDDIDSRQT